MTTTSDAPRIDGNPPPEPGRKLVLRLYVAGGAPRSTWAIRNIRALCEKHLAGRYDLEVIDIHQQPELASEAQLIAAPTLVKQLPLPLQRFIGTMADTERILVRLDFAEGQR